MEAIGPGPGPLVGGQVTAPEAVDGLLGVPHQHHQMAGPGAGFGQEGPLQDPPLDRIGVLEFIDQGDPVAPAQGRDQGSVVLAGGARIEALEQLGKTHAAAALAPPQQLLAGPMAKVQQGELQGPIHQLGDRLQQGPLRQGDRLVLVGGHHAGEGPGVEVLPQQRFLHDRPVAGQCRWRARCNLGGANLLGDPAAEGPDPVGAGFGGILAGRWEGLGAEPGPQVGGGAAEGLL